MDRLLAWAERLKSMNVIPWLISAVTCLFGILTFARNAKKERDSQRDAEQKRYSMTNEALLTINIKLDQINTTMIETRAELKKLSDNQSEIDKRLSIVEMKVEAAQTEILAMKGD